MTWEEFKNHVDEQIKDQGISSDLRIEYIDVSWPDNRVAISEVRVGTEGVYLWIGH